MDKNGGLSRKEQIERDLQTIARLQNRVKQNRAKEKERERKARTKRLIELGAIVESRLSEQAVAVFRVMPKQRIKRFEEYLLENLSTFGLERLEQELIAEQGQEKEKKVAPKTEHDT